MNMQTVQFMGPTQQQQQHQPPPFRYNGPPLHSMQQQQQHLSPHPPAPLPHPHQHAHPHHHQQQQQQQQQLLQHPQQHHQPAWFVNNGCTTPGGSATGGVGGIGGGGISVSGIESAGSSSVTNAAAGFLPNTNPICSTTPIKGKVSELNRVLKNIYILQFIEIKIILIDKERMKIG